MIWNPGSFGWRPSPWCSSNCFSSLPLPWAWTNYTSGPRSRQSWGTSPRRQIACLAWMAWCLWGLLLICFDLVLWPFSLGYWFVRWHVAVEYVEWHGFLQAVECLLKSAWMVEQSWWEGGALVFLWNGFWIGKTTFSRIILYQTWHDFDEFWGLSQNFLLLSRTPQHLKSAHIWLNVFP